MSYTIKCVTAKDAPEIAKVQMSAFYPDLHFRALWCQGMSLAEKIYNISQRQPYSLTTGLDFKRHLKVIDTTTGDTVGYARWILPKKSVAIWLEAQPTTPTEEEFVANKLLYQKASTSTGHALGVNLEMLKEINPPLLAAHKEIIGDEADSYLRLDYIAVLPSHQRRGVASLLIEQGLAVAKVAGLKTIVTSTTPAGSSLFKSHDFKVRKSVVQDESIYGGPKQQITSLFVL